MKEAKINTTARMAKLLTDVRRTSDDIDSDA
jgi:hypothetical protein